MVTRKPNRTFLYIAAGAANMAVIICGTALGWTSPMLPRLQDLASSPLDHVLTLSEEGWVGSLLPLAATVGPIIGGVLADKIGRKNTLIVAMLPFLVSYLMNIFASTLIIFYVARFLCGLGAGITFTALPMYVGEISDDEVRGALGSFMQLFAVMGLIFSYVLGPYLSFTMFNIVLLIPPFIFFIIFGLFIPDSPYYLIQNGKTEAALQALAKLRGQEKLSNVQKEMEDMEKQIEENRENKGGIKEIFQSKGLRKAIMLSFSLLSFQQLSGVNVIYYYTQSIFSDAGVRLAPEICTILIGLVQLFPSAASLFIVEKTGKRLLLIFSSLGMSASLGILAYYFYLKDELKSDVSNLNWFPIACLLTYTIAYCVGFGPVPWAIAGELFPVHVKPIALAATTSVCWTFCFLTVNYFGLVTEVIGNYGSFGFFSGCSLIATIFVWGVVPETRGLSLSEIQLKLSGESQKNTQILY